MRCGPPSGSPSCWPSPASAAAEPGATAETVLWEVWSHTRLAERWERASLEGGQAGEAADRDLDAVVALFEAAARFCDRLPAAGPEVFLDHLLGPADPGRGPGAAGAGDRRGAGADRPRRQGPGVGRGVRPGGAGGQLAGPADARVLPRLGAAGRPAAPRWSAGGAATAAGGRAAGTTGWCRPRSRPRPRSTGCSRRSGGCSTSRSPGPGARCW